MRPPFFQFLPIFLLLLLQIRSIVSFVAPSTNSFAIGIPALSITTAAATAATTKVSSSTTSLDMSSSTTTSAEQDHTLKDRPFGSWVSPITSQAMTAGSVGIGNLHVSSSKRGDTIYWSEARSHEGGRNVLCRYDPTSALKSERNAVDITSKTSNVRSRIHEYGGAAMTFAATQREEEEEDAVFYTEFSSQQLFRIDLNEKGDGDGERKAAPIVTEGKDTTGQYRYADGIWDQKRKLQICIREDHGPDGKAEPKDVVNEIVALDVKTTTTASAGVETATTTTEDHNNVRVLVTGYDFAVAPRLSLDGNTLFCIVWDHPNMPWDATRLIKVSLPEARTENILSSSTSSSQVGTPTVVAGHDNDTSVIQPCIHPLTGKLFYLSDQSGYYNIYMMEDDDEQQQQHYCVLPMAVDFGGSSPGWTLGQQGFSFLHDGRLVAVFQREGESVLVVANVMDWTPSSSTTKPLDTMEYTSQDGLPLQFGPVQGGTTRETMNDLYFLGGSPSTPGSVYSWTLPTHQSTKKGAVPATVLACSSTLKFPDSVISIPQQIEFPTTLGTAFGYYYPPKNGDFTCSTEQAPPLLVKAHGGPTGATGTMLRAGIQYWTSRGFAILDVDYGGSTGYGRSYRRRLRKSWGIVDVDDVCNGAQYLVQEGLADPERLCIDGGSAGGYTTLAALAFRDVFKAGCSLYGVADLSALASDTHKFESRYLDGLVGKYPDEAHIYTDRAPIEHLEQFSCPILLLQGDEDKIVPPNQAEMMYAALKKKKIPTCLKMYQGEQHGFRKAENVEDAIDSELSFYGRVFGIDIPGAIELEIENME
mmetsp:Transcript_41974/g.47509  ORF Transcript_41974/g.47509 Transcript_41974/m.47509 type:complete len:815 (+) Transcript_41974:211-2655(+)